MTRRSRNKKRILIVDGQPLMRLGLEHLIDGEPDLTVSCQADSARQTMNLAETRKPDLVVMDLGLSDRSGLELIKDIQAVNPALPLLVFSVHDESLYAERVLRAGARGYVMKREGGKTLLRAIRQVLEGRIYVSEKIAAKILEIFSGRRVEAADSPIELLSDREFEVFQLIGQGKGTRDIAAYLRLSAKTVEVHRANIKRKLSLKNGAELVRYAIRWPEEQAPLRDDP